MQLSSLSSLVDTSLRASVVIFLLLWLRPALRSWIGSRALAWLWLAVAVRLLFPLPVSAPWHFPSFLPTQASTNATPFTFRVSVAPADAPAAPNVAANLRHPSPRLNYSAANLLTLLWLAGVLLTAARLARGWWITRRWAAQTFSPDIDSGLPSIFLALPSELRRGVALRLTDALDVPTLVGILRPQIWLPRTLSASLTPAELRHVLLHELGHARRRDLLCQWLCSLACCLHWFNPLVWLLARTARTDRELACDAWVLSHGALENEPAASYGHTLLKIVAGMCRQTPRALPVVSMAAGKRHLDLRVREIRAFRPVAAWPGVIALAATLALVATLTVRGAAAGTDADPVVSTPQPSPASSSPVPPVSDSSVPVVPPTHSPESSMLPPQVEIESKFIEMSEPGVLTLEKSVPKGSPLASVIQQLSAWYAVPGPVGMFRSSLVLSDDFQLLVRQLNQTKDVDLLSAPRVTTKSGQKATIEIIREMIYPSAYERGKDEAGRPRAVPTNFDKTNTGLSLEANPTVSSGGNIIDLSIGWKITSFDGFVGEDGKPLPATNAGAGAKFPIFTTRSVNTVASLTSGSTVVFSTTGSQAGVRENLLPDPTGAKPDAAAKKAEEGRLLLVLITVKRVDPAGTVPGTLGATPASAPSSSSAFTPAPQAASSPASLPYGKRVPGKQDFVTSPYAPDAGYIDLRGFTRDQSVRDPYTGKMFLVP